ncbi:drug/metabolite transporter (DMT)-like permease [Paenibacillus taihuensis]|uniref:Drug/metabolite transporter (DMT)-like permease n=1 Tax=Paenibacillus taihuensis TaxID=1156355 RepID=A0A3D9RIZ5_9BACL|nr:DMT family transporter [Paenibacillus taihuensis]REE78757.1 drug/metabolite transporter (DMT)-like permease [Paenibacillus taihuensis]
MKQDRKWLYYLGLVIVAAVWGANFGVTRKAMETFDPILFTFLRFSLSLPLLLLLLKIKEGSVGVSLRSLLHFAIIGLVGITGLEIIVVYSIKYTTLANASLLNVAPWPIFAAIFGPLFMRERISQRLVAGGAAAMIGVCFVILGGGEGFNMSSDHMIGNLLALSVSIIGALYNLACMPLMKRYSALRVSTWIIVFGVLFMFPLTLGSWGKVDWSGLTIGHYSAVLYNVVICTVIAFSIWNASMFQIGAARANFFRYVVPAAAVAVGYVFFNERISLWQLAGTLFMAAGLVWISLEKRGSEPPASIKKAV